VAVHLATQHYKREVDRRRHEAGLLMAGLPACHEEAPAPNRCEPGTVLDLFEFLNQKIDQRANFC
jgi:hypothetical protein